MSSRRTFVDLREIASIIGVNHCRGIMNGQYCDGDHQRGFVRDGIVHMADRKVMRRSMIREFLVLAVEAMDPAIAGFAPWEARYLRCVRAERLAREALHIRLPSTLWNHDRWTVRAQLVSVPVDHPTRSAALAWSRLAEGET